MTRGAVRCASERTLQASFGARIGLVLLFGCVCFAPAGCAPQDSREEQEQTPPPEAQHHESGPVRVTLSCDKSRAQVAEPILLQFTVEHPADWRVVWPPVEGDWGGFALSPETSQTRPSEGEQTARTTKRYTLRSLRSGEQTIPELTLRLASPAEADAGEGQALEIVTRPIDLEIVSVLTGEEAADTVLQADGVPVALPAESVIPWKLPVIGLVAMVLLGFLGYRLLRWLRDRRPPPVIIPAHRWALDQLDRLGDSDLIAKGRVHEYYFQLSAILRGYLERRFGILAPEMTTEEFVEAMGSDRILEEEHRRSLGPFLESCDLVKFARHVPGRDDIEGAFGHARNFIIETADYDGARAKSGGRASKPSEETAA